MRALPQALQAHLESGVTTLCRCWRLSRTDGVVMGFTDHDRPISFDGLTFSALDGLEASGDVTKAGYAVGGLEIAGAFTLGAFDDGELQDGRYDGASVALWLVNWADPQERVLLRKGTLGEVRRVDGAFSAEVRGPAQALETVRGRVVTRTCDADLGDARCALDRADLAETARVVAVDRNRIVVSGVDGRETGWFSGGTITVTNGPASGASEMIVRHTVDGLGVVLTLREPILALEDEDRLSLTPGCDKRFQTCVEKFSNGLNFQGFPHLPGNDRALGYARPSA